MFFSIPWIVNPVVGALSLLAVFLLGKEIGNKTTGYIAMLLALVSPFIVFMSSEFMSHATALLMTTLFILFYIRTHKFGSYKYGFLSGVAIGYLLITRPHTVIILLPLYAVHALWMWRKNMALYSRCYLSAFAGVIPFFLLYIGYNWATTGKPFLTGYRLMHGLSTRWLSSFDSTTFPWLDLLRASKQIGTLNEELFCWPIPSLFLLASLFAFKMHKKYCYLLALTFLSACISLMVILHIWTHIFSARYLYDSIGVVIVLSALAIQRMPALARRHNVVRAGNAAWVGAFALIIVGCTIYGFTARTGELFRYYGKNFVEGNIDYYNSIMSAVKKPALVFVENDKQFRHVLFVMPQDNNPLVVFALNKKERNSNLMSYYPERHVYMAGVISAESLIVMSDSVKNNSWCLTAAPYQITKIK
jgi:4-amino-4-deoxy-L-arabinose transferase-like glycosyltransferase